MQFTDNLDRTVRLQRDAGNKTPGGDVILTDNHDGGDGLGGQAGDHVTAVDLADAGNSGRGIFSQCFHQSGVFRDGF